MRTALALAVAVTSIGLGAAAPPASAQTVTALGAARAIVDLEPEDRATLESIRTKHQQATVFYVGSVVAGVAALPLLLAGAWLLHEDVAGILMLPIGGVLALASLVYGLVGAAYEGGAHGQRDQLLEDTGLSLDVAPSTLGATLLVRGAF